MARKVFKPRKSIRSQPPKRRLYSKSLLKEAKLASAESRESGLKVLDELEWALKMDTDDEILQRVNTKGDEIKGRIFADTEFFDNLHLNTNIYVKSANMKKDTAENDGKRSIVGKKRSKK